MKDFRHKLESLAPGAVRSDVPLGGISRWRVGGSADFMVSVDSPKQLSELLRFLEQQQSNWLIIGHTSNLLFCDAGVRGVILQVADGMSDMHIDGNIVRAQGGIWIPGFASRVGRSGLTGIEHTVGIPGTLGGLVCMNGGSMRQGIGDRLIEARCLDRAGNEIILNREQCEFAYRKSKIQEQGWIVTEASFQLEFGNPAGIRKDMLQILKQRRGKFPLKKPNCGSVFVSDPAMYKRWGPPGAIIEKCGLKGQRVGGAVISPMHANFIVNEGQATANDILELICQIRESAKNQFDCELKSEVRFVTERCEMRPAHEFQPAR